MKPLVEIIAIALECPDSTSKGNESNENKQMFYGNTENMAEGSNILHFRLHAFRNFLFPPHTIPLQDCFKLHFVMSSFFPIDIRYNGNNILLQII